jgi:hypothetical protein
MEGAEEWDTEAADNIWLTCCALHNLLIDVDGLSVGWEMVCLLTGKANVESSKTMTFLRQLED